MRNKTYHACPDCQQRMKRTKRKMVVFDGSKIYVREMICPNNHIWYFDEYRNSFGRFVDFEKGEGKK